MPKKKKIEHKPYTFIVDKKETWKYKRKNKKYKRNYEVFLHRNNSTLRYCAYFGYWKNKTFIKIWIETNSDCEDLKEELYEMYENHISILLGETKLVKVCPKLLEEGYAPVQKNGKVLPEDYWDEVFMVEKINDKKTFDMKITADNSKTFKVSSEHFKRTYPDYWWIL